jgi:prepilin-type N-terminal cleavage/methylation domain-containing protein
VRAGRRGFSLIEMMVVVLVASILAGIGLLKYIDLRNTALTASLAGDVRSVQVAALNYYADFETWPPEAAAGQVPVGLAPYLPGGLTQSFVRPSYTLDYQSLVVDGDPMVAVAVSAGQPALLARFIATYGNRTPFFVMNGVLTYLIAGPGGTF